MEVDTPSQVRVSPWGFPLRWESVGFCPIDASIRGWQGLPSGYVLWNRITNYYSRLARTTFWETDIRQKDKKSSKNDKTGHGMEKRGKVKANSSQAPPPVVEPFNLEEPFENLPPPLPPMDDQRTMAQLLEAPTAGYEDAIVVPEITEDNFELKHGLLNLVIQPPAYQAPAYQAPAPQIQGVSKGRISKPNVKANDSCDEEPANSRSKQCKTIDQSHGHAFQICTSNTASTLSYHGPMINYSSPKVLERKPRSQRILIPPTNNGSTEDIPPPVVPIDHQKQSPEPENLQLVPSSASRPNQKASIPFPSRRNDERRREKANDQIEKFYEIFRDLSFEISFTDALMLMPKFASTLKTLIGNKEKLSEMARTPLNENCSAVILNKLPKKLGDPGRFLIPCEFSGINTCNALADLGASINLMPYSVWKNLSLPELTPTCMTLELADRSISEPIGIAEDVYVTVGKFQFPADFVVVDFEPDPRVPLILGRSFLKTSRALIDVYEGEITLRVGREAITFNLDQTSRYTANYNHMTANRIDVIDMACEEYSQEVLGFSNVISSGNPTPYYDPIVSTVSPTLTPFGDSDFLLFEEADSFLAIEDDPTSPEVDPTYYDPDGDILLLEAILNSDPSPPPPNQENYFPETRKDLKICEANSSVNEPPEVELKDLPPHLEYAFLEGDDKLPVIIAKDLKNEEKAALIEVLKSHKRAIAWKLSDIKGINPEFCTHKILMEEDYEPTVQHQRRVNPKIHDVIKKEVEKLLDAGLIYPISDSPWVSPVHCVPKKGGMTVVKNDENDLIPTRLVTGWRVCIDYRKLNEATRKDHFPLPFMDQMLERLAGNQFYCFLDGFSGYFQIPIDPKDQEKTTFTCPYGTFAYRRMPFGLCNAPDAPGNPNTTVIQQNDPEPLISDVSPTSSTDSSENGPPSDITLITSQSTKTQNITAVTEESSNPTDISNSEATESDESSFDPSKTELIMGNIESQIQAFEESAESSKQEIEESKRR
ncbi:reverse transcriptase domain-containing protein [Tanacetum coccineum]